VRGNEDKFEKAAIAPNPWKMVATHPKTASYYTDFDSTVTSFDDAKGLTNVESVWDSLKRLPDKVATSFNIGRHNLEVGKIYSEKIFDILSDTNSPELAKRISEVESRAIKDTEDRNFVETGVTAASEMVPLLKYLVPVLERRLKEVREGYLWATPESKRALTDLREIIEWGCKRANITTHITPHSLRHAFAVRCVTAGIHLRTVQLILRHSSSKVTEIYTRLATAQILADVEKF